MIKTVMFGSHTDGPLKKYQCYYQYIKHLFANNQNINMYTLTHHGQMVRYINSIQSAKFMTQEQILNQTHV